jgi:hypothetical protein
MNPRGSCRFISCIYFSNILPDIASAMAFSHAQNTNTSNGAFNEVGRDQYFQIAIPDHVDRRYLHMQHMSQLPLL